MFFYLVFWFSSVAAPCLFISTFCRERGFSFLKRRLTALSNGLKEKTLDNTMMIAMNAPKSTVPDPPPSFEMKDCVCREENIYLRQALQEYLEKKTRCVCPL